MSGVLIGAGLTAAFGSWRVPFVVFAIPIAAVVLVGSPPARAASGPLRAGRPGRTDRSVRWPKRWSRPKRPPPDPFAAAVAPHTR